ncbi:MAG: radical SAM protein [Candidatus Margulisiibacteriota bacterium]
MRNKPVKYIDQVTRPVVRSCPCAVDHISCGYVVISHIIGCPYDCSYCFLHTFYGKDEIVVYNNESDILAQVSNYLSKADRPLRLGTGQYSDSLALPEAISLAKKLVGFFAGQSEHLFEIKTKSDAVDELLDLDHKGRTVVAWSLNPEKIVRSEECGAGSLMERIQAAKKCVAAGYPVGFHFDPIIHYSDWEEDYQKVVDLIFSEIDQKNIAWISLGALRYKKERYSEQVRVEIFKKMNEFIRSHSKEVFIYLCMESEDVWEASGINNSGSKYEKYFKFFRTAANQ